MSWGSGRGKLRVLKEQDSVRENAEGTLVRAAWESQQWPGHKATERSGGSFEVSSKYNRELSRVLEE